MIILYELFENISDFSEYVPGISADITFPELNSSAISARKQIQNIITSEIWSLVIKDGNSDAKTFLCTAFGNLTMNKASIFTILSKRMSGGAEVYKHELETIQRQYIDNYYNAMDSLIQELTLNDIYKKIWFETPNYKLLDSLHIKTTSEFNNLYNIDMSFLFFFRTISIQQEVLDEVIGSYFQKTIERKADFETKLKRALAQLIVATAIIRFDIIELPATIRSLYKEQKSLRHGTSENTILMKLAETLTNNALETLKAVDLALTEPSTNNIDPETSFNREDDKIFLL